MNTRTKKVRRRARLALAVLAGALVLPGLAAADHLACTPGSTTDPCEKFDPQLLAGAEVPFTDTPSTVTFRVGQADHDQPILGATYLAPKGWQFAVNSLRKSQISESGHADPIGTEPATACNQVILGEGNDSDDAAANLGRADNLSGNVGVTAHIQNTRSGAPLRFGYTRLGPDEGNNRTQNPSLSFLGWDAAKEQATLCLYLYANTSRVVRVDPCNVIFTCSSQVEEMREHIIPVKMSKVKPGELMGSEDISLKFGWKFEFDLTSFYGHEILRKEQISLTDLLFNIQAQSGGNWNINPVTQQNESIVFSKTPKAAGEYEFRAVYSTCEEGFSPTTASNAEAAEALPVSALCASGKVLETTRSTFQKILNPPNANVLRFGALTGPSGALASAGTPRFGLVRGTNDVTFTWSQPSLPLGEAVKGYVLTVARPGEQDSRHFTRVITNPTETGFDPGPCGAAGDAASCTVTLSFPLNTIGSDPLDVDGKYDVSLVTLYVGQNGAADMRSDGLCDDGTGFGADCPITDPAFRVDIHRAFDMNSFPGVSTWQLMLRDRAWPVAYVTTGSVSRSGGGPTFTAPLNVLLVDFNLRIGEFTKWNALGFEERFFAPSNLIQGDNASGGLVQFGSTSVTGHTQNWMFAGRILPAGGGSSILGVGAQRASGQFLEWNLKGLPGAVPPGGMPSANLLTFGSNNPV